MKKTIFGIVPINLNCDDRLSGNDLRVYVALASFQGKKDNCFPSLKKISERCGIHKNHIPKHTKNLEECGYIEKIQRGKRISNVYRIVDNFAIIPIVEESEYTETAKGEYTETANSEYTKTANSNIKTTIKTTPTTTTFEEEVIFNDKYFRITKKMVEEWEKTYPNIKRFRYELTKISDVIREREQKGEIIGSPIAFLHAHLKRLNIESHEKTIRRYPTYDESNTERGREPKQIGNILKGMNLQTIEDNKER